MLVHASHYFEHPGPDFLTAIDDVRIMFEHDKVINVPYPVNKVLAVYHLFFPSRQDINVDIEEARRHRQIFDMLTTTSGPNIHEFFKSTSLERVKLFSSYYDKTFGTNLFSSIILNGSIDYINILIREFELMPSLPYTNNDGRLIMINKYNPFFCDAIRRLLQRNPSTYELINEKLVLQIYRSFFIDYPPKLYLKGQQFY
jgi:hypothetical protein